MDRSSEVVSSLIFEWQGRLRRGFLDQISKASMHERDNLRQWRRVLQLNTHHRCVLCVDIWIYRFWKICSYITGVCSIMIEGLIKDPTLGSLFISPTVKLLLRYCVTLLKGYVYSLCVYTFSN